MPLFSLFFSFLFSWHCRPSAWWKITSSVRHTTLHYISPIPYHPSPCFSLFISKTLPSGQNRRKSSL